MALVKLHLAQGQAEDGQVRAASDLVGSTNRVDSQPLHMPVQCVLAVRLTRASAWQPASWCSGSPARLRLLLPQPCTVAALQEVCQRLLALDPDNDEAQMMLAEMQFQQVSHSVGQTRWLNVTFQAPFSTPCTGQTVNGVVFTAADGTAPQQVLETHGDDSLCGTLLAGLRCVQLQ